MAEPTAARRTFGPVVLVAALAGGALAMAGTQPWYAQEGGGSDCQAPCTGLSISYDAPGVVASANAVGLLALACLGVVLVTRGRLRRAVAAVGLVAALGGVASVVNAWQVPDDLRDTAAQYGATTPDFDRTGWFWIGGVAAVLGVLAWSAALRFMRHWPEMARRYDAPADAPPDDLWKAIDQGHDPTS